MSVAEKRKADRSVSPPALKRKVQSTTTSKLFGVIMVTELNLSIRECRRVFLHANVAEATREDYLVNHQ